MSKENSGLFSEICGLCYSAWKTGEIVLDFYFRDDHRHPWASIRSSSAERDSKRELAGRIFSWYHLCSGRGRGSGATQGRARTLRESVGVENKKAKVSPINRVQSRKETIPRRRLGELLVEAGLLNPEKLTEALNTQKKTGKRLYTIY